MRRRDANVRIGPLVTMRPATRRSVGRHAFASRMRGKVHMRLRPVAFALALVGSASVAHGGEPASFILNWVAGGDHAPYFYAQSLGWYKTAGIDLTLLQGKGSSMAAQAAGAGLHPFGLADLTTVMVAIGKGADEVAVMN